jgi:hypothetical protein
MTRKDLLFLQSQQEYPSVSIILNLAQAMPDRQGNRIKIKNAIDEVKDRLLQEFSAREIKSVLDNVQTLTEALNLDQTRAHALALFANQNFKEAYSLPVHVKESVTINSTFETRNIIWALNRIPKYWVLALSEKPSRFFYGTRDTLSEIIEPAKDTFGQDQDGFPYTYLPPDVSSKSEMMGESGKDFVNRGHTGAGYIVQSLEADARYYDDHKRKFFERVFKLAERFLAVEPLPLVIVCEDKNHGYFEQVSHHYPVAGWLRGDYCKRTVAGLEEAVWPIMREYLEKERQKKITEFTEQAMGTPQHAFGIDAVWRAAQEGRVKDLLIEEDFEVAGIVNPDNKFNLLLTPKGEAKEVLADDIVNLLIETVLSKGEKVSVTFCAPGSLKKYGQVAAVLRY